MFFLGQSNTVCDQAMRTMSEDNRCKKCSDIFIDTFCYIQVNPIPYAIKLRDEGVKIIAIGVADLNGKISISELEGITGNKSDVYTRDTFDEILKDEFLVDITKKSCDR